MALLDFFLNTVFQIAMVVFVIAIVFFKLGGKLGTKTKLVNRAEIIRKKMINILKANKSRTALLVQKDNTIGLISNVGFYTINGKKIYCFLYSPKLIKGVPKFWSKNVFLVSEDYLKIDYADKEGKKIIKRVYLQDNYFVDEYFNIKLNLSDTNAMNFLKTKVLSDESETTASVFLAQALRLSTVDFSKPYEPPKVEERYKEIEKIG